MYKSLHNCNLDIHRLVPSLIRDNLGGQADLLRDAVTLGSPEKWKNKITLPLVLENG